jgi:hypothetical protein
MVYDIANEQTISVSKTIPISTIQGCDLYKDRIMLMGGLATNESPNMITVFDRNGNAIADYHISEVRFEFEDVCVNRANGETLFNDVNRFLYSLNNQ